MAFSDSDFVKLNLPTGTTFTRNGVTMSLDDAVTAALDEAGSRAGALASLFLMLETDQYKSEKIGRYSYDRWGMAGSQYWQLQALSVVNDDPPNVVIRPSSFGGC